MNVEEKRIRRKPETFISLESFKKQKKKSTKLKTKNSGCTYDSIKCPPKYHRIYDTLLLFGVTFPLLP